MIEPQHLTEQLMYTTARVTATLSDGSTSRGSAFFYDFPHPKGLPTKIPTLVTNKHVIEGAQSIEFLLHVGDKSAKKPTGTDKFACRPNHWVLHPDDKVDLCALPLAGAYNQLNPKEPFYKSLDPTFIPTPAQYEELGAVEDILMIGYPNGLWDSKNNFPLIRRGITASHPAVDFDLDGVATTVIDMACFPGSSGSPVVIYNTVGWIDKKGETKLGGIRFFFIGVLFSGPTIQTDGEIVIRNIPTKQVAKAELQMMMNLGYIIKPKELEAFNSIFEAKVNAESAQ